MQRTCCVVLLPLLAAATVAQDGTTTAGKPPVTDKQQKLRQGGFHGLDFTERAIDGGNQVVLRAVQPGSDAERLGFRRGDRIVAVNGKPIDNGDTLIKSLYGTLRGWGPNPQPRVEDSDDVITVERDGERVAIEAGLADLDAHPAVGELAPDFTLQDATGTEKTQLSRLWTDKPVVLVFGSYT